MKKLLANLKPKTNTSSHENTSNPENRSGKQNKRRVELPSISPGRYTNDPKELVTTTSSPITERNVVSEGDASQGVASTEAPSRALYVNPLEAEAPIVDPCIAPKVQYINPSEMPSQSKEKLSGKNEEAPVDDRYNTPNTPYGNQFERLAEPEDTLADQGDAVFKSFIGVNRLPKGKILIGDRLGSGAFGDVYRGEWGEKKVALKKIDFKHARERLGLSKDEALEALSWEMSRLSTVNHPNLVQFYGIYQHENEGATYLVTEFCEGGDLRKELDRNKNISWATRWQWVLEISESLAYLHSEGVLHRDLKAENILLDGPKAKLADLGVSQVDALLQESEAQVVANGLQDLRFIAPENVDNRTLSTKATDIYALGLVLWEIASGEVLRWEDGGEPLEEERIPKSCPPSFKELILKCCNEDPSKRPSAEEVVKRIKLLGPELSPHFHILIKACNEVEKLLHPKRKEGLAYIEPFVTAKAVEEPIENYWDIWETSQKAGGSNPPLNLKDTFKNFLKKPGSSTLLLLGEAGLGKTLTTYLWAEELMRQWWSYIKDPTTQKPPYFPIFIRDAVANWAHSALKGAYLKILEHYGLKDIPVLVFVDGYDELQMNEAPRNLSEHLGLLGSKDAKLVITCRPKAVEGNELDDRFSFKGKLETYHFLPFSIHQLLGYLKEQLGWEKETEGEYKNTLQASKSVREVLRNPFVLYLLRQSWETLSQHPVNELNRWKIYEGFVKNAITTQSSLLSSELQNSLATGYLGLVESFKAFASDVAFRARQKDRINFNVQEAVSELTYPWLKLKELVGDDARKEFANRTEKLGLGATEHRRALLNEADFIGVMQKRRQQFEDDLPLEIRRDEYTFSHKSIFEYFVAKRLLEIFESKDEFISSESLSDLINKLVESDPEVLLFLHEGWKETETGSLKITLFIEGLNKKVSSDAVLVKIAMLLNAIGEVLRIRTTKYAEALEYHQKDLAIKEQVYGKDHPDVAYSYASIGNVLDSQGKYGEALEYYLKALVIYEKFSGKDDPRVAASYGHIGRVLNHQGKYDRALEYYKKAIDIYKQALGENHPRIATSYNNIGALLNDQGKYDEAIEYLRKALDIQEKVYGKDNPDVARSYNNMGMVLNAQGKYDEAIEYLRNALDIDEKVYGKDHPDIATSYNNIGKVLNAQGKYDEALEYYLKALAIGEQALGKDHPNVATCYNNIGSVLNDQGKYDEALEYYLKALAIGEQALGKDHPNVATSYNNIGFNLEHQGKYAQALEYYLKALDILEKVYEKSLPNLATFCDNIGRILEHQDKYAQALKYYKRALTIREDVYGEYHPNVASSYYTLGFALEHQGAYEQSLGYFRKALFILEKVYGKGHSNTLSCRENIQFLEQKIATQAKPSGEHPAINEFTNIPDTSTAQSLLQMSGVESKEVKITVNASKIGEMHLLLLFSSSADFKKFIKYYKVKYNNLFLPNSQLEYNPGQSVEIFINTEILNDVVMPDLNRFRSNE